MKVKFVTVLAVGILAATAMNAAAATRHSSRNIVTLSPSSSSALAQANSEAMYLRDSNDGRSILYVEANNGRALDVIDVTNLAAISRIAQVTLPADGTYDFGLATDHGVVVRYRDGSGQAFISFKNYKQPKLVASPAFKNTNTAEELGHDIVLSNAKVVPSGIVDPTYEVLDDSTSTPSLVASVSGICQEIERPSSGTLFLLSSDGVTVVRQPLVEQDNVVNVIWKQATN